MIKKKILAVWRGERIPQSTKDFTNDQNGAPDAVQKKWGAPHVRLRLASHAHAPALPLPRVPTTCAPLQ